MDFPKSQFPLSPLGKNRATLPVVFANDVYLLFALFVCGLSLLEFLFMISHPLFPVTPSLSGRVCSVLEGVLLEGVLLEGVLLEGVLSCVRMGSSFVAEDPLCWVLEKRSPGL